jgi:hypothetical protein
MFKLLLVTLHTFVGKSNSLDDLSEVCRDGDHLIRSEGGK